MPFHEGLAIDAVIRRIEARDGVARRDERDPESERHKAPIDFACNLGEELVALEHTGIEAFDGQIRFDEEARSLFCPIVERLAGLASPDECFQIHVPIDATAGLRRADIPRIQDTIVGWDRDRAPAIQPIRYGARSPSEKTSLEGVPFPLSLHRYAPALAMGGRVDFVRVAKADNEDARVQRPVATCTKKFAKLAVWKQDHKARSILVLEDADVSLSNEQLIVDAVALAERDRADKPDEIYIVTTFVAPWYGSCVRRPGKTFEDEGERYWEIDPATLSGATAR
jgi:hypothetical protein